jgi:hypothetical protein
MGRSSSLAVAVRGAVDLQALARRAASKAGVSRGERQRGIATLSEKTIDDETLHNLNRNVKRKFALSRFVIDSTKDHGYARSFFF